MGWDTSHPSLCPRSQAGGCLLGAGCWRWEGAGLSGQFCFCSQLLPVACGLPLSSLAGAHVAAGGQAVRLALAAAFYARPQLLVLDEPSNHLDLDGTDCLLAALEQFHGGVILISHDQVAILLPCLLGNCLLFHLVLVTVGVICGLCGRTPWLRDCSTLWSRQWTKSTWFPMGVCSCWRAAWTSM